MRRLLKSSLTILAVLSLQHIHAQGDPELTEVWEPEPPVVTPGTGTSPPSDAIALFDGSGLEHWVNGQGESPKWVVENGAMTVKAGTGGIFTRQKFGDCQLHVEFRTPAEVKGEGQGRGNSGIFLQGRYEVQVLDSYKNRTYANGQAGSIYKQHIPLVNASKQPGEWQTYDIFFTAPKFSQEGELVSPAFVTVVHNNVLIQNHVELAGPTRYIGQPKYEVHEAKEPLFLQDHGNPVSYRNIWIRELD